MASGTAALAQKLVNKKKSNNKPAAKKSAKPKSSSSAKKQSKSTGTITPRIAHPWKKIKEMYEAGKSKEETAKACKIKITSMNGIMDRLVRGVEVDGKIIKIVRRSKGGK